LKLCQVVLIAGLLAAGCSKPPPPVDYAERNRGLIAQGSLAKAERLTGKSLEDKTPVTPNMILDIREGKSERLCPESAALRYASGPDDEFARRAREEATRAAGDKCVQRLETERSGRWPAGALFVWSEHAESGGDYSFERQTIPVKVGVMENSGFGVRFPTAAYLDGLLAFMPKYSMLALSGGSHPTVGGGGEYIWFNLPIPEAQAQATKAALFRDKVPLFFEVAFEAVGYGLTGVRGGGFGESTGFLGRAVAFRLVANPGTGTEQEFFGWTPFTPPLTTSTEQ
jgi:hypothetical protein